MPSNWAATYSRGKLALQARYWAGMPAPFGPWQAVHAATFFDRIPPDRSPGRASPAPDRAPVAGLGFWFRSRRRRCRMSSGESVAACPPMTAFGRLGRFARLCDLKFVSCFSVYRRAAPQHGVGGLGAVCRQQRDTPGGRPASRSAGLGKVCLRGSLSRRGARRTAGAAEQHGGPAASSCGFLGSLLFIGGRIDSKRFRGSASVQTR